jgi:TPR repeat protein
MILHVKDKDAPVREISIEQAKFEFKNNIISRDALCWKIGMKEWVALDLLPEMHDRLLDSPKETKLNENWLGRQLEARRNFRTNTQTTIATSINNNFKWQRILARIGIILMFIFTCVQFAGSATSAVTRNEPKAPVLAFICGLMLFRRFYRLQSEKNALKKIEISFISFYLSSSLKSITKWFMFFIPVGIFAFLTGENAPEYGAILGSLFGMIICTILLGLDVPIWVWRKKECIANNVFPEKNLAWAWTGAISIPLAVYFVVFLIVPAFQHAGARAEMAVNIYNARAKAAEAQKLKDTDQVAAKPDWTPTEPDATWSPPESDSIVEPANSSTPIPSQVLEKLSDVKEIKTRAKAGDPESQVALGWLYLKGEVLSKDEQEGIRWFIIAAEQGYAKAQHNLGVLFAFGNGVAEDKVESVRWFRKAAEQGIAESQYNLGVSLEKGIGVKMDRVEAVKWYRMAANQNFPDAQYNLGFCYDNGIGVKKDENNAFKWHVKAAELGHPQAQHNMGVYYESGKFVEKKPSTAVEWYLKAAKQGIHLSMHNLAICYFEGSGVPINDVEAYAYFTCAAVAYPASRKALDTMEKKLSSNQLQKARMRANELQSQISAKVSKPAIE